MRIRKAPDAPREPDMHQLATSRWRKIRVLRNCSKREAKIEAGLRRSVRHGRPVGR